MIFYEADDGTEIELCKDKIAAETNPEVLIRLREEVRDLTDEMSLIVKAYAEGGNATPALCKKLGYYKIGQHWIDRRLKKLGADTGESEREINLRNEVTKLLRINQRLRDRIEVLETPVAA